MSSKFNCPHDGCKQSYLSKSAVKMHYDVEHAGVRFPCATCGLLFKSKRSRDGHNKSVHLRMTNWRKSKELKCPHCTKTFATNSGLTVHIRNLHSVQDLHCGECNMVFVSADKLRYHVQRAHGGLRFECVDCEASFTSRQNLLSHIQRSLTCVLRSQRASPQLEPERKRKLGEPEKNSAEFVLDTVRAKLKNSSQRECKHVGCTNERLGYGFVGGDKIYCIQHRADENGVVNLGNMNLCDYGGCAKRGHNTIKGSKHYRFCALHRDELIREGLPEDAIVFSKAKTCQQPGCDIATSFDKGKYCAAHSPSGVSDDKRQCSMACCVGGGPRPQYVHPDDGTALCAFAARVLIEDALLHDDVSLAKSLMAHFKRSRVMVLNQQSAFRVCMETIYGSKLDTCSRVCFDEPVTVKPNTTGDLRPDIFYVWEVCGQKMAIHIEYDEGKGFHENSDSRLQWVAKASGTHGRVYVIRVNGRSGTSEKLCTRIQRGTVVYYAVNELGKRKAKEVAEAVMQRIEWISNGLAPDDEAGRRYKLLL